MIVSTLLKIEWYRRGNIQGNLNSILKIFKEFEKLWPCTEEFRDSNWIAEKMFFANRLLHIS